MLLMMLYSLENPWFGFYFFFAVVFLPVEAFAVFVFAPFGLAAILILTSQKSFTESRAS